MAETFYTRLAQKFGASGPHVKHITECPLGDPEQIFEQKVVELGDQSKDALDVGCGSGDFTLRMASHFHQIVGIDGSEARLHYARMEQQAQGNNNVRFERQDAQHTSFARDTFDVVYSRRGPTPYQEYYRILRPGGHVVVIGIGEKDAWELKKVFGRGQGFWEWKTTALEQNIERLQQAGFSIVYGEALEYDEYYATYRDLDLFLQSVPIFEDFNSEQDKPLLQAYASAFQTEKGIRLPRQRFVTVAVKP